MFNQRPEVPAFMTRVAAQARSRTRLATYALLLTGVLLLAGSLRFDYSFGCSSVCGGYARSANGIVMTRSRSLPSTPVRQTKAASITT